MSPGRKLAAIVIAGIAFGVIVAVIKGQEIGVRNVLGNLSAPWMLPPFLVGALYLRVWISAVAGVMVTLAAFLGFYTAEAVILDLGDHPWYTDLRLTLGSGRVYETWGLLSGAVFGVLGGLWASRSVVAAPIALGLAFVLEPMIVLFLWRAGIWAGGEEYFDHPWLWITEMLIGLAAIAFVVTRARPRGSVSERAGTGPRGR